jgi:N-acetylglucosaminyl-diphospho-decaprenol L-rhamnosyltransferase
LTGSEIAVCTRTPSLADPSSELDLTIIVVSYNTRVMTIDCIRSVVNQTSTARYEIIVLDNASTDGSVEAIRTNFPNINLIISTENLGFARANNVAATHARGRRILLLNPDTVILDHAIDRLLEFAVANPGCRIWGGRTVFADGNLNPGSCWGHATLWSIFCYAMGLTRLFKNSEFFNPEGYGAWKRDTVRAVAIVTGCFLLIDHELWERLDGFDPEFFMYGEEADLCQRSRKLGARPTITPTATIIHHGRASEPNQAEQRIKVFAGRITLMRRHHTALTVTTGRAFYLMLPLLRLVVYGTAGALLNRADFRHTAQNWRHVWESRQRWINGWDAAAVTSALGTPQETSESPHVAGQTRTGGRRFADADHVSYDTKIERN